MGRSEMRGTFRGSHACQKGQAMIEFLVAAMFFLVPLFLGLAIMGKFIDVQHRAEQASRYAAWERTVWYDTAKGHEFYSMNQPNQKSGAAINNEIAVRLLNDRSLKVTVIKDTDKTATTFANGIDPMWKDNAGVAYMDTFKQLDSALMSETPSKDFTGKAIGLIDKINVGDFVLGNLAPPVPTDTLAVVKVNLSKIAGKSDAYKRLWATPTWVGMDFESTGAILSNTWSANGSQATTAMVKKTVPTAQKGMGVLINTAKVAIGTWEPALLKSGTIDVGRVRVDQLPPDRLK